MRGLVNFDVGELITIDGRALKFDGLVPPLIRRDDGADDLQFIDARNRRMTTFTPEEFLSAYVAGRVQLNRALEKAGDRPGDDEPSSKKIARRWRYFWTTAFDKSPVPKSTGKLAAFIDLHKHEQPDPIDPPSPHTLRRWLRERGEHDCRRPRQMGDRNHSVQARRPVHEFVQAAYESAAQKYWSNYRVTSEDVQIEVRAAIMAENQRRAGIGMPAISVPGRTTLWRWLRQERTYENVRTRNGRHAADRLFKGIKDSLTAKRIMDVEFEERQRRYAEERERRAAESVDPLGEDAFNEMLMRSGGDEEPA